MIQSGIYKIVNKINNKCYIGSSVDIRRRKRYHFSQLRCNKHHSILLQSSFNKNGEKNFILEIIELCDISVLLEREQFYLDKYKSYDPKNGYNISNKADRRSGIEAWNKGMKFPKKSGVFHFKSIPIVQLDEDFNLINTFESISIASKECKINMNNIRCCIKREKGYKKAGGFYWLSLTDYQKGVVLEVSNYKKNRCLLKIDEFGIIIKEYKNITSIITEEPKHRGSILNCLNSKTKSYSINGFYYQFKDDYEKNGFRKTKKINHNSKKIIAINKKNKEDIRYFDSLTEAAKSLNRSISPISRVLNTKYTIFGFIWKQVS